MTPVSLLAYRETHTIEVVRDWDDDWGQFIFRCAHDHIRVHRKSPVDPTSGWVHDEGDIAGLAKIERGEFRW